MLTLGSDERIELAPGPSAPVRLYGRERLPTAAPRVLHLHGGAFRGGSLQSGQPVAAALARAGAVVVSADYPCGQGHRFPEALETAFRALRWLDAHRGSRTGKRAGLFVAGEEAGGNLAAALALVTRDRHGPRLGGQILLSPMLDPRVATCSFRSAEAGSAGCKWADGWEAYLGSPEIACHPYAAPANALRLAGLAPALLLTGPDDPMQDEARAYAARLGESGVPAECYVVRMGRQWPDALSGASPDALSGAGEDPSIPRAEPDWAAEVCAAVRAFFDHTAQLRGNSGAVRPDHCLQP
jgi:acetyl esterase/lipase